MESVKKHAIWGKVLAIFIAFMAVAVVWQIAVLMLLNAEIVNTLVAVVLLELVIVVIFAAIFWIVKATLDQMQLAAGKKTEAELAAEEARRQRIASRPSPAKKQAAADQAAEAAKASSIAVSTTRLAYQAEMKALMDIIFIDTRTKVQNTAIKGDTTEDNLEVSYRFNADGSGTILSCSLWKMSNPENSNYKPEALELSYNRNILSDANEVASFNDAFLRLLNASLGENNGKAIYDRCLAEEVGGSGRFEEKDASDTGNPYELTYQNNTVTIKVTCSEIVPNEETEEGSEQ